MTMAMCGFAAAFGAARLSGRWRRASQFTVLVCAIGIFLTLTRSVWVGTLIGTVWVCTRDRTLRRLLPRLLAGVAIVVALLVVSVPALKADVNGRLDDKRSVYDRENVNNAALRIVSEKPLTGVGWMRFLAVGPSYVRQASSYPITNVDIEVHDVLLSRAAEIGLPGAGLWLLSTISALGYAAVRRPLRDEQASDSNREWYPVLIGAVSCWGVVATLSPLPYPLPNSLVWVFAGIVLAPHISAPGLRFTSRLGQRPVPPQLAS